MKTAKVFFSGRSQAVRIPKEFRLDVEEVWIRQDPNTGEIILTPKVKRPAKYKNSLHWLIDSVREAAKGNEDIFEMRNLRQPAKDREIF